MLDITVLASVLLKNPQTAESTKSIAHISQSLPCHFHAAHLCYEHLFSLFLLICAVQPSSAHSNPSSQKLEQHNSRRKLILKTILKIYMAHYLIMHEISLTHTDNKLCRTSIVPFFFTLTGQVVCHLLINLLLGLRNS